MLVRVIPSIVRSSAVLAGAACLVVAGCGTQVYTPPSTATRPAGSSPTEGGRGLQLVAALAARWGTRRRGLRRKENDRTHGTQSGDPARAAQAIITIAEAASPPLRLLLGTDAVNVIRTELDQQRAEIDAWEDLSRSTDFAE